MKEELKQDTCQECGGQGWTVGHGSHGTDGECMDCPVQIQCQVCNTTGFIVPPSNED